MARMSRNCQNRPVQLSIWGGLNHIYFCIGLGSSAENSFRTSWYGMEFTPLMNIMVHTFVSVWAPVRKIPTILAGTVWNSLPWWKSLYIFLTNKGTFGNVVLIMLFKCCENTCGWKSIVKISVVLFKQRKLLFKQHNQTSPNIQFESSMHEINKYKTK